MKNIQFFVEIKHHLSKNDFTNLRIMYTPIIGNNAILLYQVLYDYYFINKNYNSFYQFRELTSILSVTQEKLIIWCKKLEAVGLLRTYEKSSNDAFIFQMNRPLSPTMFRNNKMLYNNLINKIGEIIFERLEFSQKEKKLNKDEYNEITTKYQDLFEINKPDQINNTLEIAVPSVKNIQEAISSLSFSQFVFYLIGEKISPNQLLIFQNLLNLGFSNKSLNLIIKYSYEINNKIVANHIKKIAEDFFNKDIKDFSTIEKELKRALESRKNKLFYNPYKIPLPEKEESNFEPEDWNTLFSSLGGF